MKYLIYLTLVAIGITGFICYSVGKEKSILKPIVADFNKEVTQKSLIIQGKIPEWLKGTFVRNGPVSVKLNGEEIPHWFDGLAMLHAFAFENGQVLYSNKFLRSDPYNEVFEKGILYFGGFSTPNRKSLWEKMISFVNPQSEPYIQNANVNVTEIAKQYVALTETPLPVRFDINTLNTLGVLE
ncbi:MAG TPA: carotenoid oxygenase family protein, partial [Gammaproteobacteria bacterium]|nr:carotenoid oxygenase family protein [Gammaproteobacteria bacterium]